MAADLPNDKWETLMAMMSRLAQPPVVNVNISVPDLQTAAKKKKTDAITDRENEKQDTDSPWETGGMPRPYVS